MIICTGTLHHRTLSFTKRAPISGNTFRPECELLPTRPRSLNLSKLTGSHSLQLSASQKSLFPRMAIGSKPQGYSLTEDSLVLSLCSSLNASEDTDDMFDDDLFNKYGKVVFRRNDQKSTSAEVADDAESLSFAMALAKVASDVKTADIRLLFVKPLVYWTRFFIIATAFSQPQIGAVGSRIRDLAETQYGRTATGDHKPNSWTLLDFGDVVVHIFLPEQRDFYNLEEFYGNATRIELPFEDQQPLRS